jgi:poly(A) polymerase
MGDSTGIWTSGVDVVARLRAAGHQAWLVGGCVRDRLLNRRLKDADVATSAEPDEVELLFPRTIAVGKAFGVIKVLPDDRTRSPDDRTTGRPDDRTRGNAPSHDRTRGNDVEVASLRADDRYIDGRRPVAVRRGTLQEDAERRDLTVNALYADPDGTIVDPVGGLADLRARLLRGIGDPAARLAEDRLRVVRVLRFAAVLGFAIEERTAAAVRDTAISGVARERVLDELGKAAGGGGAGPFLRACAGHGQAAAVAPCADVERAADILARLGAAPTDLALAAWLLPGGADAADAWLAMQPVPGSWRRSIPWLIATAPHLGGLAVAERRRALRRPEGAALARLAAAIDPDRSANYTAWAERDANPEPCPVTAADLLAAGHRPGPALGAALRRIEDAWLAGAATDRAGLLRLASDGP